MAEHNERAVLPRGRFGTGRGRLAWLANRKGGGAGAPPSRGRTTLALA